MKCLNYQKIINEFKKEENKDYTIIWDILSKIFNVNGVYELLLKLYNNSRTDLFELLSLIFSQFEPTSKVFELIREKIKDLYLEKKLIELAYNILKNYYNPNKVIEVGFDFLMNINDSKYLYIIEDIMKNDSMRFIYERALDFNDTLKNALKDTILQNNESIHLLFELFRDKTLLNETKHLLLQFTNDI